jgi:hypothetical protein
MNTQETVKRFAERKPNPREGGKVEWRGNVGYPGSGGLYTGHVGPRIFCRDYGDGEATLYSYGTHFALAHYLGEQGDEKLFLKNGDRASVTTNSQQAIVQQVCDGPTVSFSAFEAAGVNLGKLRATDVVAFGPDKHIPILRDRKTDTFYRDAGSHRRGAVFTPPKQGAFMAYNFGSDEVDQPGVWHILAATLLRVGSRYLLSAIDEGSYFVSELPAPASSIDSAFELLKPREVVKAERKGATVFRQGEWFFVATGIKGLRALSQSLGGPVSSRITRAPLPVRAGQTNLHFCQQVRSGEQVLVRGIVRHVRQTQSGVLRSTGEHKALRLDNGWHLAYRNTELASWTIDRDRFARVD